MDLATPPPVDTDLPPWSRQAFERHLRDRGRASLAHHPFHVRLHAGGCTPDEVRCWVINRLHHQRCLPTKDATILARMPDRTERRRWIDRLHRHDGRDGFEGPDAGALEAWTRLALAVGLTPQDLGTQEGVVPGVRFACDAYLHFVAHASWQEAVCASLTEDFARDRPERFAHWPVHYPWIEAEGLIDFVRHLHRPAHEPEHALQLTLNHFVDRARQQRALDILRFKLELRWTMLDAIEKACQ